MPVRKLKIWLTVFCLVSGGYSIYLAATAVLGSSQKKSTIKVDQVRVPKHFDPSKSEIMMPKKYVTDEMYQEIQGYKRYMDSIGRPIRQSLLDSMSILEEIYNSQTIK